MHPSDPTRELPVTSYLPPVSRTDGPGDFPVIPAPSASLPDTVGPYKILGLLGTGGMGVVYRAEQEQPRRQVALKVMRPGTVSPEHLRRFRHEAEALGRFQHEGIARIYDAGQVGAGPSAQPYLVMELIDGRPLTAYADAEHLDVRRRVRLMTLVCQAVKHAHQKGVIHGDLKPANILTDEAGQPKVLDFGLARTTDADAPTVSADPEARQVVGTPRYLSPEQAAGDSVSADTLSDVYALGVILYELLAGRPPHDLQGARGLSAALHIIATVEPQPLGRFNSECRGDLQAIAARALHRDRSRRYQSVSELADDLERYLRDEPVQARQGGVLYKTWKWARRKKGWAIPAAILVVAILAAIPLAVWAMLQRQRADLAEKEKTQLRVVADLKEQQNARLEADGFVQKANVAAQKGQWREAAANYDQALQAGHPDSVGLRLKKCQALLAVNDIDRCLSEIDSLAATPNLGENEGAVLLLQGDVLLGSDDARAEQLIRRAQKKGLPPGADAYAQALLAETTPEAVAYLRQALTKDPDQPRARAILELLLITLGQLPEARLELSAHAARFPDDVNGKVLSALLAGLERDQARAEEVLNGLRDSLGDKKTAALRAVVKLFSEFRNPNNPLDPDTGLPVLTRHLVALAVEFPGLWDLGPGAGPDEVIAAHRRLIAGFPLPPLLRKSYVRVLHALVKLGKGGDPLFADALEDLNQAVKVHPEGTLLHLRSLVLFGRAGSSIGEARRAAGFEEARKAFLDAADAPALLPVRSPALFFAALTDFYMYSFDKDPGRRDRITATLRRMLAAEPDRVPLFKPGFAVNLANAVEAFDLARLFLTNWQRRDPDNVDALSYRALTESNANNPVGALEAAEKVLKKTLADKKEDQTVRNAAEMIKKQAEKQIREQAERLMPAKPGKP
jgi:tetratricopeptide (TPR) repeat protein